MWNYCPSDYPLNSSETFYARDHKYDYLTTWKVSSFMNITDEMKRYNGLVNGKSTYVSQDAASKRHEQIYTLLTDKQAQS